jgi:CheY-like chemotaxis protein
MNLPQRCRAKVLVVDHDAANRERLATLLRASTFEVLVAPAGESALLALCEQREEIEWLVTKLTLQGLVCGRVLADEYHKHQPVRPVLFLLDAARDGQRAGIGAVVLPSNAPSRAVEAINVLAVAEVGRLVETDLLRMPKRNIQAA